MNNSNGTKKQSENAKQVQRVANRQKRAYHVITDCAMQTGHMRHVRDVDGFEEFMGELANGGLVVSVTVPENANPPGPIKLSPTDLAAKLAMQVGAGHGQIEGAVTDLGRDGVAITVVFPVEVES